MKLLHLYSSGIDSFIGYHMIKHKFESFDNDEFDYIPIYFDLKHRYNRPEIDRAYSLFGDKLIISDMFNFHSLERVDAHIPNRNLFLILGAVAIFDPDIYNEDMIVFINGLRDDRVNDNNKDFSKQMTILLNTIYPNNNILVKSPFDYELSKSEIVNWYVNEYSKHRKDKAIDDLNRYTFSCYSPIDNEHCYRCKACFRRNVALYPYIKLPFYNEEIILYYKNNLSQYDKERQESIKEYLNYLTK